MADDDINTDSPDKPKKGRGRPKGSGVRREEAESEESEEEGLAARCAARVDILAFPVIMVMVG